MITTKPFSIPKDLVWNAYLKVKANRGSAGIDEVSMQAYEKNLRGNLYQLWNRMSSGSYMPPPVLLVQIPKKNGGWRPLGIPTIGDRIAQMVVKMVLEPEIDPIFHEDSYGYRPGKSAHDALEKASKRTQTYNWVVDLDIEGFFDNISHDLLLKALRKHTSTRWVLLYVERWLKAPMQTKEGTTIDRGLGTPQGSVISPLLANLFLHYCMDEWLRRNFPSVPFERYADDCVLHCKTEAQAFYLKRALKQRLAECNLKMHEEKTKVVYCKKEKRTKSFPVVQFDFLGYTFGPRIAKSKEGKYFLSFTPAISSRSKLAIRDKIRSWNLSSRTLLPMEELAKQINPVIKGWSNYYGRFCKSAMASVWGHLNLTLARWVKRRYKRFRGQVIKALHWLGKIAQSNPNLFAHWQLGTKPAVG